MGGRGASSGIGGKGFLSGEQYQNEYSNVFIKSVNSSKGTVRFIEGFSPSAIHDTQEIPISELKKYLKLHGFKKIGFWD